MPWNRAWIVVACFTVLSFGRGAAWADTHLVMKETYTPGEGRTVEWWLGEKMARRDDGATSLILRLDEGKLLEINHRNQTYKVRVVLPPPEPAVDEGASKQESWSVEKTEGVEKVGGWEARKVSIHIYPTRKWPSLKVEAWMAEVGFDTGSYDAMRRQLAGTPGNEWLEVFDEIQGFPVAQEIDVTLAGERVKVRQELESAENGVAPAGTYDLPESYIERK